MATRIVMSKLSPTMEEGRVLQWLKNEGDSVDSGEVVLEVETDKANMEVEAMGSGVLRKILVPAESTVPTGTILGVIAEENEDISAIIAEAETSNGDGAAAQGSPEAETEDGDGAAAQGSPEAETEAAAATSEATDAAPSAGEARAEPQTATREGTPSPSTDDGGTAGDGGRIKASPLARRMAQEQGIELRTLTGSGPGGRIIKRDIEAASRDAAVAPADRGAEIVGADIPFERIELSQIRKAIARNTAQSLGPIPHFYLTTEIDMGRVLELRAELNNSLEEGQTKIGLNDILLKTAAHALLDHPEVNVSFGGDHIKRFNRVDMGIAVALRDGLITPVLRHVTAKGLNRIAEESRDLIARAREKKLAPEEYQGATFTVSNLGMYGIDEFTAVINPPAATILAVGAVKEKPVVVEGSVEVRSRMRVTLSCDHRAVDGAMGSQFLATFRAMLENPLRLAL